MKKALLHTFLIFLTVFCGCSHAKQPTKQHGEALDQIIAVINDDVVTQSELKHSLTLAKAQIAQERMSIPPEEVLKKQVLNQLINKKLQLQIAKQVGINITDTDLDRAVQNVATQNNMTVDDLYKRINHDGLSTTDYRSEMRNQMTIQKLQQQEVASHITIAPGEVDSFMRSKLWQNNAGKEYHLEDILVPVSDTPSTEEIETAKIHAKSVVVKLSQGQNFHDVAQKESGGNSALKGGDLGWLKLPEIPSAFADRVISMQTNDIAGPIQTSNGFHIIHLVAERSIASKQAAPSRKQVENLLMQRKFEEQAQNWVSKMRSQAFVVMNSVK
jgi:peptidyl-prolyl cis-trans isomerase SurA